MSTQRRQPTQRHQPTQRRQSNSHQPHEQQSHDHQAFPLLKSQLTSEQTYRLEEQLRKAIIAGRTARVRSLLQIAPWLIETSYEYADTHQHYSPLHLAAIYGRNTLIKLLIESGADVLARTQTARLPLYYSASYTTPPLHYAVRMTRTLLEAMQSALPDERQQAQILVETIGQLVEDSATGAFAMLVLEASGANLDAHDIHGWSPLHYAVMAGNLDAFDLLHELGVEPDPADHEGNTPLHLAVWSGSVAMIATALRQECEPLHHNDAGLSPYDAALQSGSVRIVQLFQNHPDIRALRSHRDVDEGVNEAIYEAIAQDVDHAIEEDAIGDDSDTDAEMDESAMDEEAELRAAFREHYRSQREARQNREMFGGQPDGPNEWFWEDAE